MTEEPYRSEEALVEGLKAGEQLAQLILVKRYGPRVKYLIKSISWDLAEEDARTSREGTIPRGLLQLSTDGGHHDKRN